MQKKMKIVGNIILINDSTGEGAVGSFVNQKFEIREETKTARLDKHGRLSVIEHPKNITWYGGRTSVLKGVTQVQIVGQELVLIDRPRSVPGGVSFNVAMETEGATTINQ